jgi:DNA invertase Pin-like site-specific DNA recombinase
MANGKFVAYFRVSTAQQGSSGLSLEAQQASVKQFLNGGDWELAAQFVETVADEGADALAKRPQLRAALDACGN